MLCSQCRARAATTTEGHCAECAAARWSAGPRLASPVGLCTALVALFCAVIAADLFALLAGARVHGLMTDVVNEDFDAFTDEDLDRADLLYAASGMVQLATVVATAVVFLVWFHRVRKNAQVFDPGAQRMAPGWAIGGWFVPFANFVLPRRVAGDIWAASTLRGPDGAAPRVSYALVNAWWTVWVCTLVLGRYASRMYDKAEEADEVREAAAALFAVDLLDIVAAVLALLFVRKLTRMQHAKATGAPVPFPAAEAGPRQGGAHR
ncbi:MULTISPECIES: DUF4328 domain-containing protein [unclassified Streptomyces]|uniref:DUF4328 domain-containing protein n=1 Tax=unclassified Streptomyces TaxID=2593676 RepID=UPI00363F922F